jgi:hypothetical protein
MTAVLGLDTSTAELTVALVANGTVIAEREAGPDAGGRPRHATALLPAVEAVLAAGGGRVGEIVTTSTTDGRRVTWSYMTDPDGNIVELQAWSAAVPEEA